MNRWDINITAARIAGYHDDEALFTRLVAEYRSALDEAWREGRRRRELGMLCDCYSCEEERVRHERRMSDRMNRAALDQETIDEA